MKPIEGSKGGCFPAWALVETPNGQVAIEKIKIGDKVVCFDEAGVLHTGTVLKKIEHVSDLVYKLLFWGGQSDMTSNHWVLNQFGNFSEAGRLTEDDAVVDHNGHLRPVLGIEEVGQHKVYNITVSPHHTFICNGIRVHNGGRGVGPFKEHIEGSGGGGGGKGGGGGGAVYTPREAPNTLRSKAVARVIDLISEGQCLGLWDTNNPEKSIFYNDVPLMAADGSYNFSGVKWYQRYGTPDQDPIPGQDAVEAEKTSGQEVLFAAPVLFSVSNNNVDALRVKMRVPSLYQQQTNGDLDGASVEYKIEVSTDGGPYVRATNPVYDWLAFTGASRDETKGLRITAKLEAASTISSGQRTYYSTTYQVQYRKDGGSWVNWDTLVVTGLEAGYAHGVIPTTPGVSAPQSGLGISKSLEVDDLPLGSYEVQILPGTWTSGTFAAGPITEQFGNTETGLKISGKTVAPYEEQVYFQLPEGGPPWTIRVSRLNQESASAAIQDKLYVSGWTELTESRLTYPNCALIGQEVDSQLFGGRIPKRSFDFGGLIIKVPSNYDAETREYDGVWDGTFQLAWTNNPAWILYDLLTERRYGLGEYIGEDYPDKWVLYQIAQYCDELVEDGFGGEEPRFTLNTVINTRETAYAVVNAIVSVFRGMAFWAAGAISFSFDAPTDVSRLVTPADVIGGDFNYKGSSLKSRHSVALVTWNDPEDAHRAAIEVVEDPDSIAQFGWNPVDVVAYGCSSRGQARRLGLWILDSERNETETVTYTAGFDHADCAPGMIVAIADPTRAGARMGGRAISLVGDVLTIDAAYTAAAGDQVLLTMEDDTIGTFDIASSDGAELTLTEVPPLGIVDGAMYIIQNAEVIEPELWRIIGVAEIDKHQFEITALTYDPTKFARIEEGLILEERNTSVLPTGAIVPATDVVATETLYKVNNSVKTRLTINWTPSTDPRVTLYRVDVMPPGATTYQTLGIGPNAIAEVPDAQAGDWKILVYAQASSASVGDYSVPTDELTVTVVGKTAPPGDVTDFTATRAYTGVRLDWTRVTDLDLIGYEIRRGQSWDAGTVVTALFIGTSFYVPLTETGDVQFFIKAIDELENESVNAASLIAAIQPLPAITGFRSYQIGSNIRLIWDQIQGIDKLKYEIRRGSDWDTALSVATINNSEYIGPLSVPTPTTFTFLIRPVLELSDTEFAQGPISTVTLIKYPTLGNNIISNRFLHTELWPGFISSDLELDLDNSLILKEGSTSGFYDFTFTLAAEYFGRCWIDQVANYVPVDDIKIDEATGEIDAATYLITPLANSTPQLQIFIMEETSDPTPIAEATGEIADATDFLITELDQVKLFEEADYQFTSQAYRVIFTRDNSGSYRPDLSALSIYFDLPDFML